MAEKRPDSPGPSQEAMRQRLNELAHEYSDEELGIMLRAAMLAQQQEREQFLATERSFSAWLRSAGLGALVSIAERLWEAVRKVFG
jgi:hypothetical protein